jgi:putative copper resistance protein D
MIEPAIVVVRLLQYAGAAVLVGAPLLFVWLVPAPPRAARWVGAAAAVLAGASLLAVALQAILFAGSVAEGLAGESLAAVALTMGLGQAALVRAAAAGLALVALVVLRGRVRWTSVAGCGLVAAASLAWLGHAGAGESTCCIASARPSTTTRWRRDWRVLPAWVRCWWRQSSPPGLSMPGS